MFHFLQFLLTTFHTSVYVNTCHHLFFFPCFSIHLVETAVWHSQGGTKAPNKIKKKRVKIIQVLAVDPVMTADRSNPLVSVQPNALKFVCSSNAIANFDSNTANRSLQLERQGACRDSHFSDGASICNNNEKFKGACSSL